MDHRPLIAMVNQVAAIEEAPSATIPKPREQAIEEIKNDYMRFFTMAEVVNIHVAFVRVSLCVTP